LSGYFPNSALFFFFSSRRRHTRFDCDWSSDVCSSDLAIGGARVTGAQLGAAFIRPNPRRPDRYVVVVEGVDALGTWRALSLPDRSEERRVGKECRLLVSRVRDIYKNNAYYDKGY